METVQLLFTLVILMYQLKVTNYTSYTPNRKNEANMAPNQV